MHVGILITDSGPHSAEKWAIATAGSIIQVAADAAGKQAIEGRKLENKIIDILEGHHQTVQDNERAALKKEGATRLAQPLDVAPHAIDGKVAEIVAAAKGSLFEEHFAKPEVQKHIREAIGRDFTSSLDVERSWHADRALAADPNHAVARHYHKLRSQHGAAHVHLHAHSFPRN